MDLKIQIQAQTGIPPEGQRLIFGGAPQRNLADDSTLDHCNICHETTVNLVPRSGFFPGSSKPPEPPGKIALKDCPHWQAILKGPVRPLPGNVDPAQYTVALSV